MTKKTLYQQKIQKIVSITIDILNLWGILKVLRFLFLDLYTFWLALLRVYSGFIKIKNSPCQSKLVFIVHTITLIRTLTQAVVFLIFFWETSVRTEWKQNALSMKESMIWIVIRMLRITTVHSVTFRHYSRCAVSESDRRPGFLQPFLHWAPNISKICH